MKIIGVVGILDIPGSDDRVWRLMCREFEREYPGSSMTVVHCFYLPWQKFKMREYIDSIVKLHDTGEDIMLVGYSLGGVIAVIAASRFLASKVRCVVTIGTPHKLSFLYRLLDAKLEQLSVPLITLGGAFDLFVPAFLTRHPYANVHTLIFSDHLLLLIVSTYPARCILRVIKDFEKSSGLAW